MDRRRYGPGDIRSRFHPRRHAEPWAYDPIEEESRPAAGRDEEWPEIHFDLPRTRRNIVRVRRSHGLVRWLFDKGWMSVISILGLMAIGLIGSLLRFR